MARSKDSRKTHLKQRGDSWYLNFPVPTDVQSRYLTAEGNPKSHIVQALGTTDLNEASRIKYRHIHQLQIEFRKVRRELAGAMPHDLEVAQALAADLKEAANQEDYELAETLADVITDKAQRIHEDGGETKESLRRAQSFVKVASGERLISDAFQDWMDSTVLPERTRGKYKTAIDEFVRFLGPHALLSNITFDNALRYTDWLNGEARSLRTKKAVPLAYNTKRDRIQALSTFWTQWIKRRQKTTETVNPWASMSVTAKPTGDLSKWDSLENTGRPKRREWFEESDLLAILAAPGPQQNRRAKYTKRQLVELFSLALLTGARPDELCSLKLAEVKAKPGEISLRFNDTKTGDDRTIPVVHPIALSILEARIAGRTDPKAQLFKELRTKGTKGESLYELIGRALGRMLDKAVGLPGSALPYAARHTFMTLLGNMEGVKDHAMQRYVGHKPKGMTDEHYRGVPPSALLAVARKVQFPTSVEAVMRAELGLPSNSRVQ